MRSSPLHPRRRARLAVVALALVVSIALAGRAVPAASQPQITFTPTPCPEIAWRYSDPSFTALPGARAIFGQYEGGLYRMEIPNNWNGELVLAAHGFTTTAGPEGDLLRVGVETSMFTAVFTPGIPPQIRQHLIDQGFAWAASSYRCNGYVPGVGLQDTMLLRDVFRRENGGRDPDRTYLIGPSMGGHVTILGLHQFPTAFDGGLAFCPAGPELFDFFLATGAAAEAVTGVRFTTLETLADTTAQILELTGRPESYTDLGRQLASIQINISGGPRPFAEEGLASRFAENIGGSYLAGSTALTARAATNAHIAYGIGPRLGLTAAQLNATVPRKPADESMRGAAGPYNELKPFDGRIERPLLTLHNTGDLFVPIFLEQVLKRAVDASGRSDLLVQRIIRSAGHCTFSPEEAIRAFDDLVRWVRDGTRPEGDDVLGDLSDAGRRFTDPLRPNDPGGLDIRPAAAPPVKGASAAVE